MSAAEAVGAAGAVNPYVGLGVAALGAVGSISKPAGPSSADSVFSTNLGFDNSGWNVSFGNNAPITSTSDKTTSQGGAGGLSGNIQTYLPYAILFVAAIVALKVFKK
jgi:hypothetical protein